MGYGNWGVKYFSSSREQRDGTWNIRFNPHIYDISQELGEFECGRTLIQLLLLNAVMTIAVEHMGYKESTAREVLEDQGIDPDELKLWVEMTIEDVGERMAEGS
jgi:hypothetical protein